jgi:Ca-activated chloride channel family protein
MPGNQRVPPLRNKLRVLFGRRFLRPVYFLGILLCSCSGVPGRLLVMEGSFHYSQGRYHEAIAAYLRVPEEDEAHPYAAYGLGTVYLALEEGSAALDRFSAALEALTLLPGDHRELRYRIHYNTGVVRFQQGDTAGAAEEFRRALETDGSRIEAKRNLELSRLAMVRRNSAASLAPLEREEGERRAADTLYEYIRQKEQDRWKSREWAEDVSPLELDY